MALQLGIMRILCVVLFFLTKSNGASNTKNRFTPTDAALAINSVQFLEMLVGIKNSAEIKTYSFKRGLNDSVGWIDSLFRRTAVSRQPSYNQHVAEYIGHLWFVKTNGIKFRETIKVLSISPSGESSTVECSTEYYNGSTWVHCSRIVCVFHSIPIQKLEDGNVQDRELGVKMALDCELLVWLPLPGAASRAVKRQIGSVFESAARAFLMGIRKASW
jgi:hypothetical protein